MKFPESLRVQPRSFETSTGDTFGVFVMQVDRPWFEAHWLASDFL
jgi:hypothetical protein